MSLRANIDHLTANAGVIAASVQTLPERTIVHRGPPDLAPVLEAAFGLLERTGESTIRVVTRDRTILLQTEGQETAAVVISTGHPIAKSLRRMIRRMSKKVRPSAGRAATTSTTGQSMSPAAPVTPMGGTFPPTH